LEESPGAGIRVNGDNDNRNGFADWQEAMVADIPKKDPPAPPMPGGGMDGMY
jgi:hypothetical protein